MSLEHSPSRLLSDRSVAEILGCSRASVWRRAADGVLPQPIKIGGLTRWTSDELEIAIERAKAAREQRK